LQRISTGESPDTVNKAGASHNFNPSAMHRRIQEINKIMANILEQFVLNAGDKVQQTCAAAKGARQLKEMADERRDEANTLVADHLKKNLKNPKYKGPLDWQGTPICVKHTLRYTWENYRPKKKPEDQKTAQEIMIELQLEKRLLALQSQQDAEKQVAMANSNLKAAKAKVKALNKSLAELLPDSECIHDDVSFEAL
jgi:hypothetical protein